MMTVEDRFLIGHPGSIRMPDAENRPSPLLLTVVVHNLVYRRRVKNCR